MADAELVVNKVDENWYQQLVDDCRQHSIEALTASKWIVICAFHAIGSRILQERERFEQKGIKEAGVADKVAKSTGINRQYVYDSINFARKFPDLNMFPGDKAMSWNKVRQQYLLTEEQKEKEKKDKLCPKCGYNLTKKQ